MSWAGAGYRIGKLVAAEVKHYLARRGIYEKANDAVIYCGTASNISQEAR
jgi:hypothetical protein